MTLAITDGLLERLSRLYGPAWLAIRSRLRRSPAAAAALVELCDYYVLPRFIGVKIPASAGVLGLAINY